MFTCSYPVPRAHVPWTIHIANGVPSSIPKGYLGSMHKPKRARNWLAVPSSVCDISLVPADNTRNTVRFLVGPAILAMSAANVPLSKRKEMSLTRVRVNAGLRETWRLSTQAASLARNCSYGAGICLGRASPEAINKGKSLSVAVGYV
jgi:hypothetical protein